MNSPDYIHCSNCGDEITRDSDFCPHCGSLFSEAGSVQCDRHPDKGAEGICIICRALCCGSCGKEVSGKFLCGTHKGIEVQQDWARIFQSSEINDSALVQAFLESNGYKVLVQNFDSAGYVWEGGGDSPISRSALSKPAKVFVPIPEFLKAESALEEWESGRVDAQEDETDNTQ